MKRPFALVVTLVVLVLAVAAPVLAQSPFARSDDSGSISRDAHGPQPTQLTDPLGGTPTPRVYLLGQSSVFALGLLGLALAAVLGVYTILRGRPIDS